VKDNEFKKAQKNKKILELFQQKYEVPNLDDKQEQVFKQLLDEMVIPPYTKQLSEVK